MESGTESVSYTYTEPTIFFEYAYEVSRLAKKNGLFNVFVTNGYMTEETIQTIHPYLDAANIDLKSFRDDYYRKVCKGRLAPVLKSIERMKKLNIWVEVTTLVVPGQNDSEEELKKIAIFLAGLDISERHQPDCIDAEFLEVLQLLLQPLEVADSISIAIVERADMDLIDDCVLVPEQILRQWQARFLRNGPTSAATLCVMHKALRSAEPISYQHIIRYRYHAPPGSCTRFVG